MINAAPGMSGDQAKIVHFGRQPSARLPLSGAATRDSSGVVHRSIYFNVTLLGRKR